MSHHTEFDCSHECKIIRCKHFAYINYAHTICRKPMPPRHYAMIISHGNRGQGKICNYRVEQ